MSAPLLFLGHAADRTGPPIYLLHFLRWLRTRHPEVDIEIALLAGGELEDDFRALAPTSVYHGGPTGVLDRLERAWLLRHLDLEDEWWAMRRHHFLRRQMRQHAASRVVYVNSAPSIDLARALPPGERVLLSHVHELEIGLTHRCPPRDRQLLLEGARRIFVVADAVKQDLVEHHDVDPQVIAHHPGMVDLAAIEASAPSTDRAAGRKDRSLPAEGLVVGAAGTVEWRKGVDLFLRLAHRLRHRANPGPLTFVWLGGGPAMIERAERAARDLGVDDLVRFVGAQPDPVDWFRLLDVFVLPSREDPFPLVCLEAAAVGVPVVAFDTGGIPELLERGCGLTATYPDLDDLATKVLALLDDPAQRAMLGNRGRELMRTHHDVTILAPRLWADIEPWLR